MRLTALFAATALVATAAHAQDAAAILDANHAATSPKDVSAAGEVDLKYAYSGQGMTGMVETTYDLGGKGFIDLADVGPTHGANGFDGRTAWVRDMSGAVTPQAGGDMHLLAVNEAYRDANLWWRADRGGGALTPLGSRIDAGQRYDVVAVTPMGGKTFEAWFDPKTRLLSRTVENQGAQTVTTFFSDYRPENGMLFAGNLVIDDGSGVQYRQTQTLTNARFGPTRPAAAYAAPTVHLTDARIDNARGETTVPFELLNNHIYADVMVNGKGPFRFIFDTGGHDILTPETAKALSVSSEGQAAGGGAGEGVVDTSFARGVDLKIGDLTIKNQTVTVLSFEAAPVEGFEEQGMIGFEVFRRFVTRIDYGARTLTFIDPKKFDGRNAGVPVPFVFYNHLPQVAGAFEGVPGMFDIDTGSRVELTLTKPFVTSAGLMAKHPNGVTAVDGWGVGGRSRSYITRASELTLGPVRIDNLVAGFATQDKGSFSDPNYQGNVGSGLLKRFVTTFDYDHQILYLKPLPAPVPDTGTFDRAGVWINTSPNGFKIVDLTAGGPAAMAGLNVGDEIVAIDGAPATAIPISDMRYRLRNDPAGARLALSVQRGGATKPVTLVLKDQI